MKNFWNNEYNNTMKDLRDDFKKEVYNTFLEFDLNPSIASDFHYQLICEVIGDYLIQGEDEEERTKRLDYAYNTNIYKTEVVESTDLKTGKKFISKTLILFVKPQNIQKHIDKQNFYLNESENYKFKVWITNPIEYIVNGETFIKNA